jgi:hypothetical protein
VSINEQLKALFKHARQQAPAALRAQPAPEPAQGAPRKYCDRCDTPGACRDTDYRYCTIQPAPDEPAAGQDWKVGNEFAPFHPDASHVPPDWRDGWNACYRAAAKFIASDRKGREVAASHPPAQRAQAEAVGPKCSVHGTCPDAMSCEIEGRCVATPQQAAGQPLNVNALLRWARDNKQWGALPAGGYKALFQAREALLGPVADGRARRGAVAAIDGVVEAAGQAQRGAGEGLADYNELLSIIGDIVGEGHMNQEGLARMRAHLESKLNAAWLGIRHAGSEGEASNG